MLGDINWEPIQYGIDEILNTSHKTKIFPINKAKRNKIYKPTTIEAIIREINKLIEKESIDSKEDYKVEYYIPFRYASNINLSILEEAFLHSGYRIKTPAFVKEDGDVKIEIGW